MEFGEWMTAVDQVCQDRHGLSMYDLPDATWRDYFDDGLTPNDAMDAAQEDGLLA